MKRGIGELKVLPDSSSDGRAAWVIEATPKPDQAGQGKTVVHYDKESGQMIKMVAYSPDGKPMTTMTFSDIKVNDKISPDRFVFKAPPGQASVGLVPADPLQRGMAGPVQGGSISRRRS